MLVAALAGLLDVVERLTEAKAEWEAKGGENIRGAPEAWKAWKVGRAIRFPIVFGPKRSVQKWKTKRRVRGLKKLRGQSAQNI